VLEQGQVVVAVFGFDRLAVEFDLRPLQKQQRPAEVGDGLSEFRVLDGVQGFSNCAALSSRLACFFSSLGEQPLQISSVRPRPRQAKGNRKSIFQSSCPMSVSGGNGFDTSRKAARKNP